MKMVIKTLKFSKWSNGIHFYISAILYLCPHMFMHVYIYVEHVNVEEEASCTKHLRKGRNMVCSGHSLKKETPRKDQGHGGKSISLISKAHEKLNPKSIWGV